MLILYDWRQKVRIIFKRRHVISSLRRPLGRAIAQAISRRLPTAAARARVKVRPCGICGGSSDTGAGFLLVFGFPGQFSFHRLLHTHHLSSGADTIGQLVADVPSGLSLTPPQETKKKKDIRLKDAGCNFGKEDD
jgi:hypothetical protein